MNYANDATFHVVDTNDYNYMVAAANHFKKAAAYANAAATAYGNGDITTGDQALSNAAVQSNRGAAALNAVGTVDDDTFNFDWDEANSFNQGGYYWIGMAEGAVGG